jgi:hypothetical protein
MPMMQNFPTLDFFNLSYANHMLSDSSGGINTYMPLRGSAAAEVYFFSNN